MQQAVRLAPAGRMVEISSKPKFFGELTLFEQNILLRQDVLFLWASVSFRKRREALFKGSVST